MIATTLVPVVRIRSGPKSGRSFPVREALRVGRHPANDLSLEDNAVSRRHASIEVTDEGVYVVDHRSVNGTFVNDKRVADRLLILNGDRIRMGRTEFLFEDA